MALLGELYEQENHPEETYKWYLEAALADDTIALQHFADMYKGGTCVRQSTSRAEELAILAKIKKNHPDV